MDSQINRVAERLQEISRFLQEKNRRLEALLQLFTQDPTLPIEAMVREYSAALDEVGICARAEVDAAQELGHRQRAGVTKRRRNRERLIAAGIEMILAGRTNDAYFGRSVAELSGISEASFHHHFGSKNGLLAAAYDHLLQPMLSQTTERT